MQAGSQEKMVIMKGSYAIDRASDLARELGGALGQARVVALDISGLDELDLSALQLLYAASASAAARGGAIRFVGTASAKLCGLLVAGGFSEAGPLSGDEFAARLPGFGKAPA